MTRLLAVKLLRDVRASLSRIGLMAAAIATSLTVFGSMLLAFTVLGRETSAAYMGTQPASATIILEEPIDAERMAAIATEAQTRPGVIAATGRTQVSGQVELRGQLLVVPIQIFVAAPDDPMGMARFDVRDASWPPAPNEIFVARDSFDLLGVAVGEELTVITPSGRKLDLTVAGTAYDPSLSPSPQEQTARAFMSSAALASPGEPVMDQLKVQIAGPGESVPTRDRQTVVTLASDVAHWLDTEKGLTIVEVQVPPPYAHPHQWQADTLAGSLLVGGIAAVFLSAILVANMLNGMFTRQIPEIGILKAIGARSRPIGTLYLALTIGVAAVGTLIALVPAVLIGQGFANMVLGLLGIESPDLSPLLWVLVVIVLVGVGLPALLTIVPVVRASRVTVRAAIDHHGGASAPSGVADAVSSLSRFSWVNRGLLMAARNVFRRPARTALSLGLLAAAATVFVAGMSLSAEVNAVGEEDIARRNWDVDVTLGEPAALERLAPIVEPLPDVTAVEGVGAVPAGLAGPGQFPVTRTYPDQGHGRLSLVTLPAGMALFTPPPVIEGRWLADSDTGAVVLNKVARNNTDPSIRVGDQVQLLVGGMTTSWRVVGIVEERGGGSVAYTTAAGFTAAFGRPAPVNQLRVATSGHDEATRAAVADAVRSSLEGAGVDVQTSASVSRREQISAGHLGPLITIILAIAVTMGFVGSIGLGSTMSANVLDRTREFGVMHAIGARPKVVRRIVTAEGLFIAIASCLVAILPTVLLTGVLGALLGDLFLSAPLPFRISWVAVVIWLAIVLLGAVLATEAAATRASRMTVREALAYL
jgi:putative ABC transport system permease protein